MDRLFLANNSLYPWTDNKMRKFKKTGTRSWEERALLSIMYY